MMTFWNDWLPVLLPTDPLLASTLAVAVVANVACSLVGNWLLLKRESLLGDAISHAVLPGLVVAFLLSGSLALGAMFAGALAVGLLTALLTDALHRQGGVTADASLGIVFTALFALGVVLLKLFVANVHLDTDCVWQGQLATAALNTVAIGGVEMPRALLSVGAALVLNLILTLLFWKEFKLATFDSGLATALGFSSNVLHYLLMAMTAITCVAAFEAVGSILVVAMLIVPAATAHLLCDRLWTMTVVSALVAALAAYIGFIGAVLIDAVEPAGMMAVAVGLLYMLAFLFARDGLITATLRTASNRLRIVREDLLGMLYRLQEVLPTRRLGMGEATQAVGGGPLAWIGLWQLRRRGLVERDGGLHLTDRGTLQATQIVRGHRLWEAYLVRHLGLPLDHVHSGAERTEHYITPTMAEELATDLGRLQSDPHGKQIP